MAAVPSIGRASLVERPLVAPQAAATQGLYERHAAKIQSYCHHQLGSREEAEDAVQTTFMNAFRALGRGVVPESEAAWLFKIAENVCLSRRRSSWRRGRIESPSDFDVIEEIVPGPSRQRDELIGIEDALASMPEQQRRAILLREWQGLSYREVAEELEISQSAVETLIFRARRSLAQGLEQPELIKKPKRKGLRRALHALDLGTLVAAVKTVLAGSAAVKATAAAVAVTAAAGTAATVAPKLEPRSADLTAAPKHVVVAPAASPAKLPSAPFMLAHAESKAAVAPPKPAQEKSAAAKPQPRAVPVAPAPVQQAPAAAPLPAPAAPPAVAESPAAEQKVDEGKQDEGRIEGAVPVAPVVPKVQPLPVPTETTGGGSSTGSGESNDVTPDATAPAISPVFVQPESDGRFPSEQPPVQTDATTTAVAPTSEPAPAPAPAPTSGGRSGAWGS